MRKPMDEQRSLTISAEDPFAMIFLSKKTKTNPLISNGFDHTIEDDHSTAENTRFNYQSQPT